MPETGSSPLARGLPGDVRILGGLLGIIPARAGFTLHNARVLVHGQDHPRSRGVYSSHAAFSPPATGSSPLARGLHAYGVRRLNEKGIIPARAGFTDQS